MRGYMLEKFNSSDHNFNLLKMIKDKLLESNKIVTDNVRYNRIPFAKVSIKIFNGKL